MKAADAAILFPNVVYDPTTISRMHCSGFGTIGAAFLYLDALNLHAIFYCSKIIHLTQPIYKYFYSQIQRYNALIYFYPLSILSFIHRATTEKKFKLHSINIRLQ